MLKKLTALITLLVAGGIGLSLYLPDYQRQPLAPQAYQINQASLKSPLPMADTLLGVLDQPDTLYGLQLGLFGQLQQALEQADHYALTASSIIKTTDGRRFWYILLLGPFDNKNEPAKYAAQLRQNRDISAKLIRWPIKTGADQ